MRLIIPSLNLATINKTDPFNPDLLKRRPFADSLLNLIKNIDEPLVISIDAPWGEGKSTFIHQWRYYLENEGIKSIYFDAFAHDYLDEPFVAIAGEINHLARSEFKANADAKEKLAAFTRSAKNLGVKLLPVSLRIATKIATLGALTNTDIDDIRKDIAEGAEDIVGNYVEKRIETYKTEVESVDLFRKQLEDIAGKITHESGGPLVFIVDELDRCKPSYAVDLLEKVKHLFSVRNVVFVLVMNSKQMNKFIECIYGEGVDSDTYIQKFIHLKCNLPKKITRVGGSDYRTYSEHLYDGHMLPTDYKEGIIEWIELFARRLDMSLRDLERVFTLLTLYFLSQGKLLKQLPVMLIVLFAVMRVNKPELYTKAHNASLTYDDINDFVKLKQAVSDEQEKYHIDDLDFKLKYYLVPDYEIEKLPVEDKLRRVVESSSSFETRSRLSIIKSICKGLELGDNLQ